MLHPAAPRCTPLHQQSKTSNESRPPLPAHQIGDRQRRNYYDPCSGQPCRRTPAWPPPTPSLPPMPPLNIVLRSKTQVVDDSTLTKSSLTQCTLKECAGLKSHSFMHSVPANYNNKYQATHQPPLISNAPTKRTVRTLRQAKGGNVAMGGKYEGYRESQRMLEPAESEGNEAERAALVCKLYNS